MVLFHFFFFVHDHSTKTLGHHLFIYLFILFALNHLTKMYRPISFILSSVYDHWTKIRVLIDLFVLVLHDHSTKLYSPLSFFSFFCARPFDQTLVSSLISLFLFVHNHSTKVRGHSYSLIYSFFHCPNISLAIFMALLPLYFVLSVSGSSAFIFRRLYSQ